ncbi:hypothetical protein NE237_003605 [Protea cynaroides]|uniref:Uncharacterized protein n=1 Tax=Protea cynaroides TaxID=273540 RepID=A0A9Q0KHR3_9MAGN|nr:hypothetical protein NE237_003605 [Protea cynaroides]
MHNDTQDNSWFPDSAGCGSDVEVNSGVKACSSSRFSKVTAQVFGVQYFPFLRDYVKNKFEPSYRADSRVCKEETSGMENEIMENVVGTSAGAMEESSREALSGTSSGCINMDENFSTE